MKNTKTFQNLMNAYAGESQAYQRYLMFAKIAKKEGWANISAIFEETAVNEKQHASEFYKLMIKLIGEENIPTTMTVTASYPIAKGTTYENLIESSKGEAEEKIDYIKFAEIAKEENLMQVSKKFELIAEVENNHGNRYKELAELLKVEKLVSKDEQTQWKCMKCGHIHVGNDAAKVCPICNHEIGYFEKYELNI